MENKSIGGKRMKCIYFKNSSFLENLNQFNSKEDIEDK
jgi:hypothetical protein